MIVETQLHNFHRQGINRRDAYGCDLAVTVTIEPNVFRKTAFFQLKKSRRFTAQVEIRQLLDALNHPLIAPRSFLMTVDELRKGVRYGGIPFIWKELRTHQWNQDEVTVHTETWLDTQGWLYNWFDCRIGPSSLGANADGVERLLSQFTDRPTAPYTYDEIEAFDAFGSPGSTFSATADFVPPLGWLEIVVRPSDQVEVRSR